MMNEPQWVQFLTLKDKDEIDQDLVALTLRIEALEKQLDMIWIAFAEALSRVQLINQTQKENKT